LLKTLFFAKLYNLHLSDLHHPDLILRHQNPAAEAQNLHVFNYLNAGNLLTVFSAIAGLSPADQYPKLIIPAAIKAQIDALTLPKPLIVVHCHSNYTPKDWQNQHWEQLIAKLIEAGFYVAEIGLKSSLNIQHTHYQNLCGQYSLLASAEIIGRATFFVGIDSGPAHFANALGVFGFILLGRLNDFDQYNVYSGHYASPSAACLIQNLDGCCADLSFDQVWASISSKLLDLQLSPTKA
jgi:heptosyltransferase-3